MRLRHQYIISGLPRDVAILGSDDENRAQAELARTPQPAEHLSLELLWEIVRSGRSLEESYVVHLNGCRDCREFVTEFSLEARSSGFSVPDLLPCPKDKRTS